MAYLSAARLFAVLALVALAARGATAAIPVPSILATSDGGVITFINLKNTSAVTGVDILSGTNAFSASLLGSYADSRYAFTMSLATGNRYRVFVTDLTTEKPTVLGNLLLPNALFKPATCLTPVNKLMTVTKSGAGYKLYVATQCRVPAAKACPKATGFKTADVITLYSYSYTAGKNGTIGTLKAGGKAVLPVPKCESAVLLGTQVVRGSVLMLASTYANAKNQAKQIGKLAVYDLRSRRKNTELYLAEGFKVSVNGLTITTAVAGSTKNIVAVAKKGVLGAEKVYSWATTHAAYIGGLAGTAKTRSYDSIVTVGNDVYAALSDLNVPADEPTPGRIQFTTNAQLKAGAAGQTIATDIVSYFEITYVA